MKKMTNSGLVIVFALLLVGCGQDDVKVIDDVSQNPEVSINAPSEATNDIVIGQEITEEAQDQGAKVLNASDVEPIELVDVSGGNASGDAWTVLGSDGKTYHQVMAKNMPTLNGTDFYEGWLVRDPSTGDFISTGKMVETGKDGEFLLEFNAEGDLTDHKKVVITLEPDDGDPAPAAHIIEN